ncbi:hypothetical protein ACLOJK_036497 [Asimina triloba]
MGPTGRVRSIPASHHLSAACRLVPLQWETESQLVSNVIFHRGCWTNISSSSICLMYGDVDARSP